MILDWNRKDVYLSTFYWKEGCDKCKNCTNTLLHISAEITYIKKSICYEMQHLTQIDELLFKFQKS